MDRQLRGLAALARWEFDSQHPHWVAHNHLQLQLQESTASPTLFEHVHTRMHKYTHINLKKCKNFFFVRIF